MTIFYWPFIYIPGVVIVIGLVIKFLKDDDPMSPEKTDKQMEREVYKKMPEHEKINFRAKQRKERLANKKSILAKYKYKKRKKAHYRVKEQEKREKNKTLKKELDKNTKSNVDIKTSKKNRNIIKGKGSIEDYRSFHK